MQLIVNNIEKTKEEILEGLSKLKVLLKENNLNDIVIEENTEKIIFSIGYLKYEILFSKLYKEIDKAYQDCYVSKFYWENFKRGFSEQDIPDYILAILLMTVFHFFYKQNVEFYDVPYEKVQEYLYKNKLYYKDPPSGVANI